MRNALALMIAAAVAAIAIPPAQAGKRAPVLPVIPYEFGIASPGRVGWFEYRCSGEPVYNFYHGAYYPQVPVVHDGFTYRQYYRYTADRADPENLSVRAAGVADRSRRARDRAAGAMRCNNRRAPWNK